MRGVRSPGPSRMVVRVRVRSDGYAVEESYHEVVDALRQALVTGDPVIQLTRGGSDERILFVVAQIECIREERIPA